MADETPAEAEQHPVDAKRRPPAEVVGEAGVHAPTLWN